MRVAGLDHPPSAFFAQNETSENSEAVEDDNNVGESPREDTESNSSCQVGTSVPPERGHESRTCRSKLSKGAEKESTGDTDTASAGTGACTPRAGNHKSVGRPLGDRDVNSRDSLAQPGYKGDAARSRGDRVSRTPTTDDLISTLIHDPFSLDARRRLTTDTARYKHWASSSRLVHDVRQDTRVGTPFCLLYVCLI